MNLVHGITHRFDDHTGDLAFPLARNYRYLASARNIKTKVACSHENSIF